MFAHSTLVFHAVCISAIITIACRPGLPARRPGVLTATVDSALQPSRQLVCNDIPLNTGTGGLKPATGCYFEAKDTLFYFYVAKSGDVLAFQTASGRWHFSTPDATELGRYVRTLAASKASRSGARLVISFMHTGTLMLRSCLSIRTCGRVPEPGPRPAHSGTTYRHLFFGSGCHHSPSASAPPNKRLKLPARVN